MVCAQAVHDRVHSTLLLLVVRSEILSDSELVQLLEQMSKKEAKVEKSSLLQPWSVGELIATSP